LGRWLGQERREEKRRSAAQEPGGGEAIYMSAFVGRKKEEKVAQGDQRGA
jgi:hypothetical protein